MILALGKYVAGGHHIRMLQLLFGEDLREKDVNHKDKQNFDDVLHIISGSHLLENISDAVGTKFYIQSEMSEDIAFPKAKKNSKKDGKNTYVAHIHAHIHAHIDAKAATERMRILKKGKWSRSY